MKENDFVPVVGYEGLYVINKDGIVKGVYDPAPHKPGRKRTDKVIKQTLSYNGYYMVALRKNNKQRPHSIHRLLAMAFIPNPENKPTVNHKNSIRTDNRIDNLEWATYSENNKHAHEFGNQVIHYGESHPGSKLTYKQANEIRSKYRKYKVTMPMLSKEYNISVGAIQAILLGKTWNSEAAKLLVDVNVAA